MMSAATRRVPGVKPRLRGVSHQIAFFMAVVAAAILVAAAPGARAAVACAVYCGSLAALFGISALYHVPMWQPSTRAWLRRADHSAIYVLIAGTYTPMCMLAIRNGRGPTLLAMVWAGAVAGTAKEFLWVRAPKVITVVIALALGWVGAILSLQLVATMGVRRVVLFLGGGVLYSAGALIYAVRWPDPKPAVFGYHEVFHLLVVLAATMHFVAIGSFVLHLPQ